MKTTTTFRLIPAILLLGLTMQVFSQSTPDYYNRLFYLCKAWGHAKYFHTEIAKGTVNWDDQLLAALPGVKDALTDADFSAVVLQMLNSAGPMGSSTVQLPIVSNDLNLNPDLTWMDNPVFSDPVKLILKDITAKFRPQTNVLVGKQPAGNPDFSSDVQYNTGIDYPSEEHRLLALFRYWNMVHYFSPNKFLMDQPWDDALSEFIPKIADSENATAYNLAFKEMTTHLHQADLFTSPAYNAWNGEAYPPFIARFIEGETVITKVLSGIVGLKPGDLVRGIDGLDICNLRSDLRKYASGGTMECVDRSLNDIILHGPSGSSSIIVDDGTGAVEIAFERNSTNFANLQLSPDPAWSIQPDVNGNPMGVVDLNRVEVAAVPAMFAELWNTSALIFDMRGRVPGTAWTITNYLISEPVHIANLTLPDVTYPGTLYRRVSIGGTPTANPYKGKVILLVDERTTGSNEWMSMMVASLPDLTVIGSTTQGSDGNYSMQYVPGNLSTCMVGIGVFYPDGTPTQRIGIVPDYRVNQTIAGIRSGIDEALQFALSRDFLNIHPGYCMSAGNAYGEWIASVAMGSQVKSSGSSGIDGYQDFLSTEFRVEAGKSYSITLKPGFLQSKLENWAVWIDFNHDNGFDETGELVLSKKRSKSTVSGTILIPAGLSVTTRMRVVMSSSAITSPCDLYTAGEVEDYTLIISPSVPDPLAADFSATPVELVAGSSVQFTDLSTGNPTSWLWYFPGGYPPESIEQNPSVSYDVPGSYDVALYVSRSDETAGELKSAYISVREIIDTQYCVPLQINSTADYIKSAVISGVLNRTSTGAGYSLYQVSEVLLPGNHYPVTLAANNSAYKNYWKIWIDFNRDRDFDDIGECVLTVDDKKGTVMSTIAIPATATGSTRMRISMRSGASPQPCSDNFTGEVEDYEITLGLAGLNNSRQSIDNQVITDFMDQVSVYPNPVSGELNILVSELSDQNNLDIFSLDGKVLHKSSVISNLTTIDVSRWESGIYLIRINCGSKIVNRKFVKE